MNTYQKDKDDPDTKKGKKTLTLLGRRIDTKKLSESLFSCLSHTAFKNMGKFAFSGYRNRKVTTSVYATTSCKTWITTHMYSMLK